MPGEIQYMSPPALPPAWLDQKHASIQESDSGGSRCACGCCNALTCGDCARPLPRRHGQSPQGASWQQQVTDQALPDIQGQPAGRHVQHEQILEPLLGRTCGCHGCSCLDVREGKGSLQQGQEPCQSCWDMLFSAASWTLSSTWFAALA